MGGSCQGKDVDGLRRKNCSTGMQKKKRKRVGPTNSSRRDVKDEAIDEIDTPGVLQYEARGGVDSQSIGRLR